MTELDKWLAAQERRVAAFEVSVERAPISMRRGRWLERTVPVWAAASRERFTAGRTTFRLDLSPGGSGERLLALEAREASAFARLLARVAEERAKGWPRRTLYGAGPEVG